MFGLSYLSLGAGAIAGALVAGSVAYWIGHSKGDSAGYARYAAEQASANNQAEKDRNKDDARIQNLSDYTFCVESLKRRGLQYDACESLRGIPTQ